MSTPSAPFILQCPKCGKKYQGDASKPDARYACADDQTPLVPAAPPKSSTDTVPAPPPTQKIAPPGADLDRTMVMGSAEAPKPQAPPTQVLRDDQATRIMGGSITPRPSSASSAPTVSADDRPSVLALLKTASPGAVADDLGKEKYEVVGKLGQGGVGQVLKVVDRDLKREVAMKMLLPEQMQSSDSLIRFVEEAQATGQLEHPNIVPVHDLGVDAQGQVYFTLKYVQGLSLKSVIRGRKDNAKLDDGTSYRDQYSPLVMIEILISMCQAMAYAHSKGIIHRDLKPDNVMLGKFGEVLVMDWGLAKVLAERGQKDKEHDTVRVMTSRTGDDASQTMEGSIAGTPAYMSPEQAAGKISELDQRTDVYALGAILYEILSGEPPYRGAGALELVKQVVQGPPSPLKPMSGSAGFNPIPRELKAICEKAMARLPEDRYRNASELRDDLQAYLENQPVSAAPDNAVQRAVKWVRRNKRQVQTSAISAAVVLALFFGGWFAYRQWTIRSLLHDASAQLNAARAELKSSMIGIGAGLQAGDPYAQQMQASVRSERFRIFRNQVNAATDPLRRVLDMDPQNARARLLLAESYMELWRRALEEDNTELARSLRQDVERYAPDPSPFAAELNGYGSLRVTFSPADTESFLFTFAELRAKDKDGKDLPVRLVPVPYDPADRKLDESFLKAEQERIRQGRELPPERHSVFNLEPTAASRLGKGSVNIAELPPGSYMLLARAPGHPEARIPFRMGRNAKVEQSYVLPKAEEYPPGFFFVAGGDVVVGGTTAGAPPPHTVHIGPAFIFHDEISMGEYAAFLNDLVKTGRMAEAKSRLPKDFGRNLANWNNGRLIPADGSDPVAFAKSPVRGVSYNDAMAYVAWRTKQDGLAYRLPKDWEWEGTCRGADARTYSWGNSPGKGLAVVTQGYGDTGSKISWKWEDYKDESPWGVHNLAGGAAEWTGSLYDPNSSPQDPVFGQYAIRGNAWALPPTGLECAFRTSGLPDYFHPTIGFRLALDYPVQRVGPGVAPTAIAHTH